VTTDDVERRVEARAKLRFATTLAHDAQQQLAADAYHGAAVETVHALAAALREALDLLATQPR
jgi:hypothetical protein